MSNLVETILVNYPEGLKIELETHRVGNNVERVKELRGGKLYISSWGTPPVDLLSKPTIDGTFFDHGPVCGYIKKGEFLCIDADDFGAMDILRKCHGY